MSNPVSKRLRALQKIEAKEKAWKDALNKLKSPEYMLSLGGQAAEMIQKRTRLSGSVSDDAAEKQKLKPLSPGYREQRKKDKAKGVLSDRTSPGKSNLTRTGQMLESIKPHKPTRSTVKVGPTGVRSDGKSNAKVAEYVTEAGRPFNNLSKIENKRIQDRIRKDIRHLIRGLPKK